MQNEAHGGLYGVYMNKDGLPGCSLIQNFFIWRSFDYGIYFQVSIQFLYFLTQAMSGDQKLNEMSSKEMFYINKIVLVSSPRHRPPWVLSCWMWPWWTTAWASCPSSTFLRLSPINTLIKLCTLRWGFDLPSLHPVINFSWTWQLSYSSSSFIFPELPDCWQQPELRLFSRFALRRLQHHDQQLTTSPETSQWYNANAHHISLLLRRWRWKL